MAGNEEKRMIVGLDIGTSKVVAVVGEVDTDGTIDIVGIGSHPSKGLKKGVVVNIESTVNAIQRAVEEAELMAGCQIHSVYVGIAGNHIRSMNSHGIVAIKDGEVQRADIDRVTDATVRQSVASPDDLSFTLPFNGWLSRYYPRRLRYYVCFQRVQRPFCSFGHSLNF